MTREAYATRREVFDLGLEAQAFKPRALEVEAVDISTGVLTLSGHGLFDGDLLRFSIKGSAVPGSLSSALPAGLSPSLVYQAAPVSGSSDLFQVQPVNGSLITSFGDAGGGVFAIIIDPGPVIDRIALNESANIDEALTAHAPPIRRDPTTGLFEEVLVGVCARRTAIRAALKLGLANPNYKGSLDALIAGQAEDNARLQTWLMGRGIKTAPPDQNTIPDNAMRARGCQPIPWQRRTL